MNFIVRLWKIQCRRHFMRCPHTKVTCIWQCLHILCVCVCVCVCVSSVSWAAALEVKWPVKLHFQLEALPKKRKCEVLNKSPPLCTNSSHPSFLVARLFNCPHSDALTLVPLTAINHECPHTTVKEWQRLRAHTPVMVVWDTHIHSNKN